jgi:predicted RND superfamily exporter protein
MKTLTLFRLIVCVALLVTPGLIFIATQTETNTQDVHTWLPNGTQEREQYDQFLTLFGHDDDILISWAGCTLEDPRLHQLTDRLRSSNESSGLFRAIINGQTVLQRLTDNRLGLSESAARKRLANVFLGPDGKTTGIVLQLSDAGRRDRKSTLRRALRETDHVAGLERESLRIGGSSYISSEIDKSTNRSLLLSAPAILICLVITFCCLRSVRLTVITLSVAGLAALTSVAMVTGLGYKINGLLVLMPVLVLVLTLSGCIHLCGYYRKVIQDQPNRSATELAMRSLSFGWRPSCMAMLTTSVGILMLSTSHIEAVRHFGSFSALSIVIALGILLLLYPALLAVWPAGATETQALRSAKRKSPKLLGFKPSVSKSRMATLILLGVLVMGPTAFLGLGKIKTTLSPTKMFPENSDVNESFRWINDNWTSLESIEVLVGFPKSQGTMLEQLKTVTRLHGATRKTENVCSAFSLANLTPPISNRRTLKASAKRQTLNAKLMEHKESLIAQRIIAEDETTRYWRIHLGVKIENDSDYQNVMSDVRKSIALTKPNLKLSPKVSLTGIWPLSAAGRHQLFSDLAYSFLMAFGIITPVVMIILRGVWVGLVAMIPNVFPALIFFGSLGWLGLSVDIGTILTASVGMGIAVDDTLHFIEWYSREQKKSRCPVTAIKATVAQCASPMFYTTLICSGGLFLFAFSQFIPPRQFAYAIVALLGLALVCDLILLPALMIGPLGFIFRTKPVTDADRVILAFENREIEDRPEPLLTETQVGKRAA